MVNRELTKWFNLYILPFLARKGFVFNGFEGTLYKIYKVEDGNEYYARGNYLTSSKGIAIEAPVYSMYIQNYNLLLNDILNKYGLEKNRVTIAGYDIEGVELTLAKEMRDLIVYNEKTFLMWADMFKRDWEEIVEPFYKKYSSINSLNEKIDKTGDEFSNHVGIYAYLKKLIIYKWANNPKYSEYSQWYIKHFEDGKSAEEGKYLNYCNAALELYVRLENGEK